MVMKKNAMGKNLRQSILKSFGRYLAIIMIIALGSSMFVGLLMTKFDMVTTGQQFMAEQNMFDLRLVSTYGWDRESVEEIAGLDGVEEAEGVVYLDVIASMDNEQENSVYRLYGIPEKLNQIALRSGRMPEAPGECLADGYFATNKTIGSKIVVSNVNEESVMDSLTQRTYTVVGTVATPLYMDMNRGSTTIGSGSLANYVYVLPEVFDMDYYPEINITLSGEFEEYTDVYNDALDEAVEKLEPQVEDLAEARFLSIRSDAMDEYNEGLTEYEDGLKTYEEEKADALAELDDAYQKLVKSRSELRKNEKKLDDAEKEIKDARKVLAENEKTLKEGRKTLEESKITAYAQIDETISSLETARDSALAGLQEAEAAVAYLDGQIATLNDGIAQVEAPLGALKGQVSALEIQIGNLDTQIADAEAALKAAEEAEEPDAVQIEELREKLKGLKAGKTEAQSTIESLRPQINELEAQLARLQATQGQLQAARTEAEAGRTLAQQACDQVQGGLDEAHAAKQMLDEQFAASEAELTAGEAEIKSAKKQLKSAEKEIRDGRIKLNQGMILIKEGWADYEEGKATAQKEFADAEEELEEAKLELDDALDTINSMDEVSVHILDRNTNVGYGSLESASDIVYGVSRVLPAFFLLVAALVCITTMTRMIDEERTQIGTLKALGYSNGAIISKYLIYAGSGAVIGCGLGVIVGSMAFPTILWEAYKIMLHVTPRIVLEFNWPLCLVVVGAYTAVMLFVTWYCCRRTLMEEPAELIRPKAPEAGKKILLEYLRLWQRVSFLNKVTIRNIFRYRQRLAMMLVGIGGCTALLLTGFGLRDSIVNIVDYQFENVTVYDMTVYFSEAQTTEQQDRFVRLTEDYIKNVMFYNQTNVEIEHNGQAKEIYLMTTDSSIQEFVAFKSGEQPLSMPGVNEVLLTVGVAENLGIKLGDRLVMRNADMEELDVTVSGIYDNYVSNYAIIIPETMEAQWNRTPDQQMAMIQIGEDQDLYQASTVITDLSGVQNVSISQDLAETVGSMMDALDLVVWVIVVCAGLLAVIVLYNLTNININERIREIATIKVLGFNASETAAYVFKENFSLTVIGAGFGLGLGYLLLLFVMDQIKIDMVWFRAIIEWPSYVWSVVLTLLAACVVNFVFYFKLDKINMAEALKSVE